MNKSKTACNNGKACLFPSETGWPPLPPKFLC